MIWIRLLSSKKNAKVVSSHLLNGNMNKSGLVTQEIFSGVRGLRFSVISC